MSGPNTTGTPKTTDYNLGRGRLYFALLDSSGFPKGYRFLGNSPEFKIAVESETLEHQSSLEGLKTVDKEVTISQKVSISLVLDEINHENLSLFLAGAKASHTNPAVAGFASYQLVADGDLELGRWYDLRNSTGARVYGIDPTKLAVATTEASPITLVEDADYTLDAEQGRIFILSTSTKAATAIASGDGLTIVVTADDAAVTPIPEVRALTTSGLNGALKFIGENPADSDRETEYQFHQVTLKANGDYSLIGDEWTQMPLQGVAERNEDADANSPTLTIRNVPAA